MSAFGILVVDKPVGPTSHAVVSAVRRGTGVRKVGHAGTLDPRASGVLVLCLGPATRLSEYLSTASKRYEALIRFGLATHTYDSEGEITLLTRASPQPDELERALASFRGEIQQVPPPFSAVKLQGRKAYELAREGQEPELEPRLVTIHELEIVRYEPPELSLSVECSAGTYIRSLANDLGVQLSTGAHLAGLRRTKAGPFHLDSAIDLADLKRAMESHRWKNYLVPAAQALPDFPDIGITEEELELVRHGRRIPAADAREPVAKAIAPNGELAAILELVEDGSAWHPCKVFLS